MLKIILSTITIFVGFAAFAQKVHNVKYASNADVKVFVVKYESQADLKVFKVKYESQAGNNDGKWFFTDYESQAKKKIFFVDYESQAELKVFFVDYESQAGWRNNAKNTFFINGHFGMGRNSHRNALLIVHNILTSRRLVVWNNQLCLLCVAFF
jgi:hypothetical protein